MDVRAVDQEAGRAAGALLGRAGASDAVDATVVLLAEPGDRILTGDPDDLTALAIRTADQALIVAC